MAGCARRGACLSLALSGAPARVSQRETKSRACVHLYAEEEFTRAEWRMVDRCRTLKRATTGAGANFNGTITATRQETPPPNNFPAGDDDSNRTKSHAECQKSIHKKAKVKHFRRQQRLNRLLPLGQADAMGTGL